MDSVCHDLGIPKNQIKETKCTDRFIILAHKSWLKYLLQAKKLTDFPIYPNLEEWQPSLAVGPQWETTYLSVYRKYNHKVIPLACAADTSNTPDAPLCFSQLLQYISQTNHQNLWKSSYKKYLSTHQAPSHQHQHPSPDRNASASINLIPYDSALRDCIQHMYGCPVVHVHLDKVIGQDIESSQYHQSDIFSGSNTPVNLYGVHAAIETCTQFILVHSGYIETSLMDCVTYSSAILDKSYNKPLFMVYQLIQLIKTLHDRCLFLGNVSLTDIYLTENLWLKVMPRLNSNILQLDLINEIESAFISNAKPYSPQIEYTINDYCRMWCHGQFSNYDYLTILNNLSGRRLGCPGSHHIMPWVSDFTSRTGANLRDLKKSKYRLNKGDAQLDLMFMGDSSNGVPHHVSDILSEITFYVYMARRTSKSLLCKYVRPIWVPAEYPASIQRVQEWTPDECIPEFFSDPSVFKSIHEDLPNLEVPAWATCPEDFIAKHREALESQYVSERLHHWIDLNFGYKLTGAAAIKAKNVCLSLVNEHKTLCQRGIVQLFTYPHPAKQFQTAWSSKTPPRIYSHLDSKRRLTRSSEDLSNINSVNDTLKVEHINDEFSSMSSVLHATNISQLHRHHSPNMTDDATSMNMERSTSYHINVQKSQNQICLPKDYNPVAALAAVENLEMFLSKTFYNSHNHQHGEKPSATIDYNLVTAENPAAQSLFCENGENSFTNRMFTETYEANQSMINVGSKHNKRLHNNLHKNQKVRNSSRNYKHIISENRIRDLQVIGCIIVEIFLAKQMRPLGSFADKSFDERLAACLNVLKYDFVLLPRCVQYPVRLLLRMGDTNSECVITEKGLPPPSAQQILQPLLNNILFPFPFHYAKVYTLIQNIMQFEATKNQLNYYTFFECDGINCSKFECLDRTRVTFNRKIAECKVKASVIQIEPLLDPVGYEQFNPLELVLPHVIDLLHHEDTSILAAWYLFDSISIALGPRITLEYLLPPILRLYDADNDERATFLNSNFDSSVKFTTSSALKSRKAIKLYHHSFLLRLIVRFGLRNFLENFVSPLIEAVGGYKEPGDHSCYHYHDNANQSDNIFEDTTDALSNQRSGSNMKFGNKKPSFTLANKATQQADDDLLLIDSGHCGKSSDTDEMFTFEESETEDINTKLPVTSLDDSSDCDADNAILKIIDQFDLTSEGSILDLRLNHSTAEEVTENTAIADGFGRISGTGNNISSSAIDNSFDDEKQINFRNTVANADETINGPTSPIIPIPTFRRSTELSTIDCEIGSKKSIDSNDFLIQHPNENTTTNENAVDVFISDAAKSRNTTGPKQHRQNRISEMSAESLIWLSHRLGPVLSARYLSRNLLKMLTLCYVGQENLLPDVTNNYVKMTEENGGLDENLIFFSIADGCVIGDRNSSKVLECLTSISALFGDHFILVQYFPHVCELITLCKKRINASLEGGLISSLQLLKFLIPCLSERTIMEQLHDVILKSIVHPIIRLLASSRCIMPSGFLARSVLARKLLDFIYVLAVRIGAEMTKEHLCVPALQRFFLIFDKAYGFSEHFKDNKMDDLNRCRNEPSPSNSSDDSNFIEIRREGGSREWCIKGSPIQITHARIKGELSIDNITPPAFHADNSSPVAQLREKAQEEICDVFNPNLAHVSYIPFLKYLGEHVMAQAVKNLPLILNLCHEFEQPNYVSPERCRDHLDTPYSDNVDHIQDFDVVDSAYSNSFGTTLVGNRIDLQNESEKSEIGPIELLDFVKYKFDQINTTRHLRGNWLAYWEHEIGRAEKDTHFNLKQIKLQTFAGHSNSVRSLLCLDNENSFMSASKDKTVKLWSLRSEGDGTKISSCQFTYTNHRKSVHSLAFLESLRLAVSCDSGVHLWDPFVGTPLAQLDAPKLTPVSVVKTYPAPSPLVLAGTAESTLKTIDSRSACYVNEWKVSTNSSGSVRCIAVAPSGTWIACGLSSGQVILFDGRTGLIIASWKATDGELLQLIAPNDQQIISSSLDYTISVWSAIDGSLLHQMKNPPEPAHCILSTNEELLFGTPGNRIGVYSAIAPNMPYSITKLRSETFKGVLTSLTLLPLNRMLLIGGDSGTISLIC